MRILFTNNYPLDAAERECAAGELPRHHLFGLDALRGAGHDVVTLPLPDRRLLRHLSRTLRFQLGDLSKESAAISPILHREVDAVVCAEMGSMRALGLLRLAGLIRVPIIGLLHPAPPMTTLARWSVDGFDRVLCLSAAIQRRIESRQRVGLVHAVAWGPDLTYSGYSTQGEIEGVGVIVCSGRTNRDFGLLARACHSQGAELVINGERSLGGIPPNPVRGKPRSTVATYGDLKTASIVAVPLARADGCFGITEVNDALGLGKPIIMTRNPFIDVDIEEIGCGRWVSLGDEAGWERAINELRSDPKLLVTMGERAREFAAKRWNYELFCDALVQTVEDVATE